MNDATNARIQRFRIILVLLLFNHLSIVLSEGFFNLQVAPSDALNETLSIVNNSVVTDIFSISDTSTPHLFEIPVDALTFLWSWESNGTNVAQAASYNIAVGIGALGVLQSVNLSIPISGSAPLSESSFNLTFDCNAFGTSFITIVFSFSHPDLLSSTDYFIKFQKRCAPPTCLNLCNEPYGTCEGNTRCKCQEGWTASYFCDFGFYLDKSEVCPGESVTISWNRRQDLALANDWISISYPWPEGLNPTPQDLMDAFSYNQYSWTYITGGITYSDPVPIGNLTYLFSVVKPGKWYFLYLYNDRYDPIASTTLTMKSPGDPSCLNSTDRRMILICVDGQGTYNSITEECDCVMGFFGSRCEHGCSQLLNLGTSFGKDFASSVDEAPYYQNNASCSWYFPQTPIIVEGMDLEIMPSSMTLVISALGTEDPTDNIVVLGGVNDTFGTGYNSTFGPYSGNSAEFSLIIPLPALMTFVSNNYNPSWAQRNWIGFKATYHSNGCPAGARAVYNPTLKTWSCNKCPTSHFTLRKDYVGECQHCSSFTLSEINQLQGTDRLNYNLACIAEVAIWRRVLAVIAITWTVVINGLCLVLLFFRRNVSPLPCRSVYLLFAYTLGSLAMIQVPLMDYVPEVFSCGNYFWWTSIKIHLFVIPVLIMLYRLRLLMDVQSIRKQVYKALHSLEAQQQVQQETEEKGAKRKRTQHNRRRQMSAVSLKLVAQAEKLKLWSHPRRQFFTFIVLLVPPFLVAILNWTSFRKMYSYSQNLQADGCFGDNQMHFTEMVFFFIYACFLAFQLFKIRDGVEGFGLKKEISLFGVTYFIFSLLQYVIILSVDPSFERDFNLRYIIWLVAAIFQYHAILVPCLQTIPAFNALFLPKIDEQTQKIASETNLEEFLKTKRGFTFFMEHCRREFSDENLMCYQDIEEFRIRSNSEGFHRIFNKYFSAHAPFPVNLADKSVLAIRSKEAALTKMDLENLQETFNEARAELLQLMESDTYPRFLKSQLFVSYCRGENLYVREQNTTNSGGESTNNREESDGPEDKHNEDLAVEHSELVINEENPRSSAELLQNQGQQEKPKEEQEKQTARVYVFTNSGVTPSSMVHHQGSISGNQVNMGIDRDISGSHDSGQTDMELDLSQITPSKSTHSRIPSSTCSSPSTKGNFDLSPSLQPRQTPPGVLPSIIESPPNSPIPYNETGIQLTSKTHDDL